MAVSEAGRRFGRQVVTVELRSLLSNPFRRPIGWILLLGSIPTGLVIKATWLPVGSPVITDVAAYLFALLILSISYRLVSPRVEARAFAAAPYRWLEQIDGGQGGAFARPDRRGRLTLYSVWADPRGHSIGSALMDKIIADTEPAGDLWLVAVNKRVVRFYLRHGFRPVRRELLGHRMVLERPRSA